jgi:hypothetical protein
MSDEIVTLTALDTGFCARLEELARETTLQAGGAATPGETEIRWAVPTSYGETFRAIVVDGEQPEAFAPPELVAAARQLSGLDEVVVFRAQANAMLPGQGLGRHTDVPEFRGARRWSFPDWLLVAMLHSGLYDHRQVRVISALVWPTTTNGGPLRIFDRADRTLLTAAAPTPGTAVVSDTTRLPHEVTTVPGDEVAAGPGDRIDLTADGWQLTRADGSTRTLPLDLVRTSVLVKFGCFPDRAARDRWFGRSEQPLDQDAVIAQLVEQLPAHSPAPGDGPELHQHLVDTFVSYM